MKIRTIAAAFFPLFFVQILTAQIADSILLPTVEVRSTRLDRFAKGLIINELDTFLLQKSQNLAEALAADGRVFVRNYGPATLATISIRNLGTSRSPVIWASLPINSPMNGTADASLLPVFSGDRILIQKGGSASIFGSGAMGGSVQIEPFSNQKKGVSGHLGQRFGSFSNAETSASFGFKNQKIETSSRAVFQKGANDFPFQNTSKIGAPRDTQTNAAFKKWDFQQHNSFIIKELSRFSLDAWLTVAERKIPPPMTQESSSDWQKDTSLRVSVSFSSQIKPRIFWRNQAGFQFEAIRFFTPVVGEKHSAATTKTLQTEAVFDQKKGAAKRLETRLGAVVFFQKARVDDYFGKLADQTRAALFASQLVHYQRVTFSWAMRSELRKAEENGSSRTRFLPLTGAFGFEKSLLKNWKSRASVSKNYNVPTFNDLFWATGGQPNLKSESGWSGEFGFDFSKKLDPKTAFSASATAFSTAVENWIQWSPTAAGGGLFFPSNLRKVWSRGLELSSKMEQKRGANRFIFRANGTFNPTTSTRVADTTLNNWLQKQLVYAPKMLVSSHFEWKHGGWDFSISENFVGKRFTQPDGFTFLKPVFLTDADLSFSKKWGRSTIRFALDCRNLFAEKYQMIRSRAMPERSFQFSTRVTF